MLRLLLLRHAKAARKDARFEDFDRPLTVRGWDEAHRTGRFIGSEFPPDLVVSSSARRARETLAGVLSSLSGDMEVRLRSELYDADADDLLPIAAEGDPHARTVMLVGHNPAFEEAMRLISWPDDPVVAAATNSGLATGGLAVFEFDVTAWRDAQPGRARLVTVKAPRDLPHADPVPEE
jgi:phosphohistidine phosphatase